MSRLGFIVGVNVLLLLLLGMMSVANAAGSATPCLDKYAAEYPYPLCPAGGADRCPCLCRAEGMCMKFMCQRGKESGGTNCGTAGHVGTSYCRFYCKGPMHRELRKGGASRGERCGGFVNRRCAPGLYCQLKGGTVGVCVRKK